MKKSPLLNIVLSHMVASLGHGDMLVIGDAGLPSQPGVPLIDLALTRGIPGFIDTVQTVLSEMQVEYHLLASELPQHNPAMAAQVSTLGLPDARQVTHEEFKQLCKSARAIVRTGECSPYANVILVAGVVF